MRFSNLIVRDTPSKNLIKIIFEQTRVIPIEKYYQRKEFFLIMLSPI